MKKKNQPKMRRRNRDESLSDELKSRAPVLIRHRAESLLAKSDASVRDYESMSTFESLPKELLWRIVEFLPEAVFDLRLASRLLCSRVDEYARQITNPIALELELIKDYEYHFELDSYSEYEATFEYLRACIGFRVEKAMLICELNCDQHIVSKLLEGVQINKLEVWVDDISNNEADRILLLVGAHKVDKLILDLLDCSCSDPVKVLLDFASLVRALSIVQSGNYTNRCLFDRDIDWGSVIFSMLSRNLCELSIENGSDLECITYADAVELTHQLPFLGKKNMVDNYLRSLQTRGLDIPERRGERGNPISIDRYRMLKTQHSS